MDKKIVEMLLREPPPLRRPWRYNSAREAHGRVNELELLLALPRSDFIPNITEAHRRINELEALLIRSAAPVPTAVPITDNVPSPVGILEQFQAISDPVTKHEFYQEHRKEILRARRELPPPSPEPPKATGIKVIDEFNAITNPRERSLYYQKYRPSLEAANRRLNQKSS